MLDPALRARSSRTKSRPRLQNRGLRPDAGARPSSRRSSAERRRADSRRRGPQAGAERRGRGGRAREEGGQGRERDLRGEQGARRSRSSSSKRSSTSVEQQRDALLLTLPNLPHASVPVGTSAGRQRRGAPAWGTPPAFDFAPKAHWELGAGARHRRLRARRADVRRALRGAARRRRAARARAHQLHARPAHARARLPRGRAAVSRQRGGARPAPATCRSSSRISSRSPATGICISIPTAEVPLTNLHREEILDGRDAAAAATRPTRRASGARPDRTAPTCAA